MFIDKILDLSRLSLTLFVCDHKRGLRTIIQKPYEIRFVLKSYYDLFDKNENL